VCTTPSARCVGDAAGHVVGGDVELTGGGMSQRLVGDAVSALDGMTGCARERPPPRRSRN
jgi:hypothetical protein